MYNAFRICCTFNIAYLYACVCRTCCTHVVTRCDGWFGTCEKHDFTARESHFTFSWECLWILVNDRANAHKMLERPNVDKARDCPLLLIWFPDTTSTGRLIRCKLQRNNLQLAPLSSAKAHMVACFAYYDRLLFDGFGICGMDAFLYWDAFPVFFQLNKILTCNLVTCKCAGMSHGTHLRRSAML